MNRTIVRMFILMSFAVIFFSAAKFAFGAEPIEKTRPLQLITIDGPHNMITTISMKERVDVVIRIANYRSAVREILEEKCSNGCTFKQEKELTQRIQDAGKNSGMQVALVKYQFTKP